jgi:hypothetical protein
MYLRSTRWLKTLRPSRQGGAANHGRRSLEAGARKPAEIRTLPGSRMGDSALCGNTDYRRKPRVLQTVKLLNRAATIEYQVWTVISSRRTRSAAGYSMLRGGGCPRRPINENLPAGGRASGRLTATGMARGWRCTSQWPHAKQACSAHPFATNPPFEWADRTSR